MKFLLYVSIIIFCCTSTVLPLDDGPYYRFHNDMIAYQIICDSKLDTLTIELRGSKNIVFQDSLCSIPDLKINVRADKVFSPENAVDSASHIFVISDFHGEFESTCSLLINNSIITPDLHWNFGDGRLVVNGDMMDRGDKVTEILWLIHRLELEAPETGGKVHFLLGNHEIMVMQGDLRYINPKYDTVCTLLGTTYDQLFSNETYLGRWLRSKHVVMKINEILFVHGGLNPAFVDSGYTIDYINSFYHQNIDKQYEAVKSDSLLSLLFGSRGPTWYRGYFTDSKRYPNATDSDIENLLEFYDVNRIVVGHTGQDSIQTYYSGKVVAINIDYGNLSAFEGLLIENGIWSVCDYRSGRRVILTGTKE